MKTSATFVLLLVLSATVRSAEPVDVYAKDGIVRRMRAVRDYQLAHP